VAGIPQLAPVVLVVAVAEAELVVAEADTAMLVESYIEGVDIVGLAEADIGVEVAFAVDRVVRVAVEAEAVVVEAEADTAIGVVLVIFDRVERSVAAAEEEGPHTKKWR